ncbi:hypothetical protein MHC_04420 [Mycoplasma haemocanis str. Illinois]|uniref:Uncharacterized protein n=1 Tax=Mycoplasma haemocanis (strain Illinois) TaxID=1111676 RepID=H6N7W8_MYCHN|nr:hypothetical protein [Mycoplasma haemocanis]AEW45740.1 hypothetical protein MHC_04420 [Mycoplasma haemocanis str. Illinois]
MAFSTVAKFSIAIGTVGGATGFAIGAQKLFSKGPSISELIKSKNPEKRLLNKNATKEAWKAAWKSYREAQQNREKDIWNIEGWKKGNLTSDEEAPEAFKKGCESRVTGSSQLYDEVVSYCTRNTTLADLVADDSGRKLLVKVDSGNTPEWKAVWAAYKQTNTNKANNQDEWKLNNWATDHQKTEAPVAFMDKCKTNSETEGFNPKSTLYEQLLKYCTSVVFK